VELRELKSRGKAERAAQTESVEVRPHVVGQMNNRGVSSPQQSDHGKPRLLVGRYMTRDGSVERHQATVNPPALEDC